jgi:hypothetical protein
MRIELRAIGCALWLLALLGTASACGDDDAGDKKDAGPDASLAPDAGPSTGGTMATGGIVPLGAGIAGKACTSTADCGGAMCATQITGATLLAAPAPEGYCTGVCNADSDCGTGGACVGAIQNLVQGQCFARCGTDDDCREAYLCTASVMIAGITIPSTCRPKPETDQLEDGVAGTMCSADDDCGGGTCLTMAVSLFGQGDPLPGGYCSGQCLEDSHCGSGGVCAPAPIQGLAGGCYSECADDADCTRDGYRCRPVGTDLRGCDAFPDSLPDDVAGKACSDDDDCGGGAATCTTALPSEGVGGALGQTTPAPDGYCSQRCTEGEDDCGAGGVCVSTALGAGSCYAPCETTADCRDGYSCEERGGVGLIVGDAGPPPPTLVCVPIPVMTDADAG